MKKLYRIDVRIYGTAYIKASSHAEARSKAIKMAGSALKVTPEACDVEISSKRFNDPELPEISLSPAMTIHGVDTDAETEQVLL